MARNVRFTEDAAKRVAAATLAYERGNRDMPPIKFRQPGDDDNPIRVGKVTAAWSQGTCATVTIYEKGSQCKPTANDPAETVENVANLSHNVKSGSWVVIGKAVNGRWYLLEVGGPDGETCKQTIGGEDVTQLPGWDATKIQLLGHDASGCLTWYDATECEA